MSYMKDLMMENEEYFHEYIKDEGIEVNGKVYHSGDLLLSEIDNVMNNFQIEEMRGYVPVSDLRDAFNNEYNTQFVKLNDTILNAIKETIKEILQTDKITIEKKLINIIKKNKLLVKYY